MKSEIKRIPIKDIVIPEERVRSWQDEESDMSLRSSIQKYGVLQPIIVRRKGDKYELIAGESRVRYAKQQGIEEIDARVYEDLPEADALLINLIENRARGSLDPKEIVRAIDKLTEMGYSLKEIADLTGFSYDYIKQWSRVRHMPEQLKEAVLVKAIELPVALEIQSIPDEEKKMDAITTILSLPETVTREERLELIRHYYKGLCDECGEEGKDVMKVGDKWLCEDCRKKHEATESVTVTPIKPLVKCRICGETMDPFDTELVRVCPECLARVDGIKMFFAFHMGYKWQELSYDMLTKLAKNKFILN
ncbi:MAG: ParB/RepB/Spo0J family partition protein [archaeon GBS-70-058]|nr:ParB/RepB/Spo0J family partition protein [Candidatus Culexarchaeum nevadense]